MKYKCYEHIKNNNADEDCGNFEVQNFCFNHFSVLFFKLFGGHAGKVFKGFLVKYHRNLLSVSKRNILDGRVVFDYIQHLINHILEDKLILCEFVCLFDNILNLSRIFLCFFVHFQYI